MRYSLGLLCCLVACVALSTCNVADAKLCARHQAMVDGQKCYADANGVVRHTRTMRAVVVKVKAVGCTCGCGRQRCNCAQSSSPTLAPVDAPAALAPLPPTVSYAVPNSQKLPDRKAVNTHGSTSIVAAVGIRLCDSGLYVDWQSSQAFGFV